MRGRSRSNHTRNNRCWENAYVPDRPPPGRGSEPADVTSLYPARPAKGAIATSGRFESRPIEGRTVSPNRNRKHYNADECTTARLQPSSQNPPPAREPRLIQSSRPVQGVAAVGFSISVTMRHLTRSHHQAVGLRQTGGPESYYEVSAVVVDVAVVACVLRGSLHEPQVRVVVRRQAQARRARIRGLVVHRRRICPRSLC